MANIVINEISDNYTYNIGDNTFATVALPITASWGPALLEPKSLGQSADTSNGFKAILGTVKWSKFPATRQGLDSFVSTYRGPSSLYKAHKDYSYQMAVTLLASGYDVLVCRVCGGDHATGYGFMHGTAVDPYPYDPNPAVWSGFIVTAKYAGTFGNNISTYFTKLQYVAGATTINYWNVVVYVTDTLGGKAAVENFNFVIAEPENIELPEFISPINEIDSEFITLTSQGIVDTDSFASGTDLTVTLSGAIDDLGNLANATAEINAAYDLAADRYTSARTDIPQSNDEAVYCAQVHLKDSTYTKGLPADETNIANLRYIKHMEFNYTAAYYAYSLLHDKLQYNPQRIVSPGWDDQNIAWLKNMGKNPDADAVLYTPKISPLHVAIMLASYYGRCGAGFIDIPKCIPQSGVWYTSSVAEYVPGYAQRLARASLPTAAIDNNAGLFVTHSALFAPWGQYKYIGVSRMTVASPSFLALLIQRAQILNQPIQYEWCLPTDRKHNLNIGKMEYEVNKATLDKWQSLEGVGVNVITPIPGLGTNLWGNSTLFEVPPATYQALANLSTRYLMNAVENVAYTVGLTITFQYNNDQAYSTFYAGVTPILDSMKNVGAIRDYRVQMSADINGEDHVNANTVIGKIYLVVEGVINDIVIDLIALPPTVDLATVVG